MGEILDSEVILKNMEQIKIFSDERLNSQCAYCGGLSETRDHVPSKILLEKPFPENLPIVPSCLKCNNGFSLDEEYFACILECVRCNSTEPENVSREIIKKILKRKTKLQQRLALSLSTDNRTSLFQIEQERVKNVILKLAYGHMKFENSETQFDTPSSIWYSPIESLSEESINEFFYPKVLDVVPEVGSRGMQYICISENEQPITRWITVQANIYNYTVQITRSKNVVKLFIWNYLLCEVIWNNF